MNDIQAKIIELMREDPRISSNKIAQKIGIARRNVETHIKALKDGGHIEREGASFGGHWIVKS